MSIERVARAPGWSVEIWTGRAEGRIGCQVGTAAAVIGFRVCRAAVRVDLRVGTVADQVD